VSAVPRHLHQAIGRALAGAGRGRSFGLGPPVPTAYPDRGLASTSTFAVLRLQGGATGAEAPGRAAKGRGRPPGCGTGTPTATYRPRGTAVMHRHPVATAAPSATIRHRDLNRGSHLGAPEGLGPGLRRGFVRASRRGPSEPNRHPETRASWACPRLSGGRGAVALKRRRTFGSTGGGGEGRGALHRIHPHRAPCSSTLTHGKRQTTGRKSNSGSWPPSWSLGAPGRRRRVGGRAQPGASFPRSRRRWIPGARRIPSSSVSVAGAIEGSLHGRARWPSFRGCFLMVLPGSA